MKKRQGGRRQEGDYVYCTVYSVHIFINIYRGYGVLNPIKTAN